MWIFDKHAAKNAEPNCSVSLPFDMRVRGRLRIRLEEDSVDAGIHVQRGEILRDGDKLTSTEGHVLVVRAEPEEVSVASTDDDLLFSRACYHVGNRHTQVQIKEHQLIYLRDHVLDEMLRLLGLEVASENLPFEPENGAYASHGHSHKHEHANEHEHTHEKEADGAQD